MNKLLPKENFKRWLEAVCEGGVLLGQEVLAGSDARGLPILPPKAYLYPQTEVLFQHSPFSLRGAPKFRGDEAISSTIIPNKQKVIFGVKACDMAGVRFSDEFYIGREFCDPYYKARRQQALFISMVCLNPVPTCFCKDAWGGPFMKEGFDIQLTDLGEDFFVEAGSEGARELLKETERFFSRPDPEHAKRRKSLEGEVAGRFEESVDLEKARQAMKAATREFWQEWADACIQCGGCTYVCPTCYCFSVEDRGDTRFRFWDSCMFEGYSRMAGGHNPRGKKMGCFKRFFDHKLADYPVQFNKIACVGCGRCRITCPTNIGMANVSKSISI